MMPPMQERVAAAEPEMAPNTALDTTATMPRPPGSLPTKYSTKSVKALPSLPRSIKPPDSTNRGMASRTTVLSLRIGHQIRVPKDALLQFLQMADN